MKNEFEIGDWIYDARGGRELKNEAHRITSIIEDGFDTKYEVTTYRYYETENIIETKQVKVLSKWSINIFHQPSWWDESIVR